MGAYPGYYSIDPLQQHYISIFRYTLAAILVYHYHGTRLWPFVLAAIGKHCFLSWQNKVNCHANIRLELLNILQFHRM